MKRRNKTILTRAAMMLLVGVLTIFASPTKVWAAAGDTYVVDANGGGDYTTISAAVSAATGGETIFIKNGEYTETVISIGSKQLTFIGESQDGVIIKSGNNNLFYTAESGYSSIVISNLTFKDISMTGGYTPISISGDGDVTIENCTFDNCASRYGAMHLYTSGSVTIDNCTLLGTKSSNGSYASAIGFGGSSTSNYTIKNTVIDGSSISDASTASYIFGAIYNERTGGTVTLDSVTISNCNLEKANGLIATKGNMVIKNSTFVDNYVYRNNPTAGFIFVNGAKTVTIETSIIQNNTKPNYILSATSASASFNLNYNNIQGNEFNNAFTNPNNGSYTLEANYWGSNTLPDGVTAATWVVENNGEYTLNTGDPLAKDIPGLTDGDDPQPVTYDVYVSPNGNGDGSSYDSPTSDLEQAMEDVPDGGSIFFLNGEYYIEYGYVIYKNVALVGESRDGVIIEFGGNGYGFMTYNISNMDEDLDLDFISISRMTLADYNSDPFFQVCSSVKEVNISDCVFNTGQQHLFDVGTIWENQPSESFAGTFNFKNNVLSSGGDAAFLIAGHYHANINNNIFINGNSGDGLIEMYSDGECNVDYNYWGSNEPATSLAFNYNDFIIATASSDATEIYNDESAAITVAMTLSDGTSTAKDYLPDYPIEATLTAAGSLSANSVTLQDGAGVVTYSNDDAGDDNIQVNILGQTLTVPITVKERYLGTIYVAKDGTDDNEGSEDAPVATVGKAIELALVEGGSGEVIINEGTYTGNGYNVTGDLTVTGVGDVTLDANEGRLFYMNYGDAASKIELSNLILTNAKGYGAAVHSYANELILDNVTIVNTAATGYLIKSNGKLTVKDSYIADSKSGDVIQQTAPGNILIQNSVFKDNVAKDGSSDYAVIDLYSGNGDLVVKDSKFINNKVKQGVIRGYSSYNINVTGSEFVNDTCTWGGGAIYAYMYGCTLMVEDSKFIGNAAGRDGGAIYIGRRTTATIDKSIFVNNTANTMNDKYYGDAIYDGNKLTVSNSVLLTNSNNYLIYSHGEDNIPLAQNCWWGTNENPSSMNGAGSYEDDWGDECECPPVDVSNWVTMDANFAPADAQAGDEVTVTAVFSNDKLPNGIEVTFTSTSGNLNTVVLTEDAQASTTYTIDETDKVITATSSNVAIAMPIVQVVTANPADGAYWSTFYTELGNYQASEGTQVFAVNLNTNTAEISLTEITDRIVKSGEGVVLKNSTTGSITMTPTNTAPTGEFDYNSLEGTMTVIETTGANDYYVLGYSKDAGVGFYKLAENGSIGANKAFLTYSGTLAREFFSFDEATAIHNAQFTMQNEADTYYDLQGRRVAQPTKGLYIVNGKKVVIK